MTTTTTCTESQPAPAAAKDHVREWKIYSFLVSALALALAVELIRLRSKM